MVDSDPGHRKVLATRRYKLLRDNGCLADSDGAPAGRPLATAGWLNAAQCSGCSSIIVCSTVRFYDAQLTETFLAPCPRSSAAAAPPGRDWEWQAAAAASHSAPRLLVNIDFKAH
jgi:hypothetical protein